MNVLMMCQTSFLNTDPSYHMLKDPGYLSQFPNSLHVALLAAQYVKLD